MKRRIAIVVLMFLIGGCLLNSGCALNVKREIITPNVKPVEMDEVCVDDVTILKWRVGLEKYTIIHGNATLPREFDMDIGSDLVVMVIDGLVGGSWVKAVWSGITAAHCWIWGIE